MKDAINVKQAVIFAGGRGERLRPLTDTIPKPMAPVLGYPFLDYLLRSLIDARIKKVLILAGYKSEAISDRYGSELPGGVRMEYSVGSVDDQTGRRLLNAYPMLDNQFLLLYGDNYWPIEFEKMQRLFMYKKTSALTTVFSNKKGTGEYGGENNVTVGTDQFIWKYDKQRRAKELNGVDIGFFILDKNVLDPTLQANISFEEEILTRLARERKLIGYITDVQYYYITTLESLQRFERAVQQRGFKAIDWKGKR